MTSRYPTTMKLGLLVNINHVSDVSSDTLRKLCARMALIDYFQDFGSVKCADVTCPDGDITKRYFQNIVSVRFLRPYHSVGVKMLAGQTFKQEHLVT